MTEEKITRKLTAILYADVSEYSRLTGLDEVGTHKQLSLGLDLIAETIRASGGNVVHYAGDAVLADFTSVVAAVMTAVAIQERLAQQSTDVSDDLHLKFRIGVNLGEVIVDRNDIYGDGVNVAARLESLAEPGGICVSAAVREQVEGKIDLTFQDLGPQTVKNIARPVHAFAVTSCDATPFAASADRSMAPPHQEIRFCTAHDGTQIAYSIAGEGPALVKTANWLNHLEYDWESPIWTHVLKALAAEHRLIRYDQRGNGLSDWEVADISFEAWMDDLEAVVDAAELERFSILGISQGCAVAIAYAARHPERVSRLVLYGGYVRGKNKRGMPSQVQQDEVIIAAIQSGWGQNNPAFRQLFTSLMIPGATHEQMDWFNELQRRTTTAENAVRIRRAQNDIDVSESAAKVSCETLVLHLRDDAVAPFEEGRRMAAMIPGARFVALDGQNHLILEREPAWPRFLEEVTAFLARPASDVD